VRLRTTEHDVAAAQTTAHTPTHTAVFRIRFFLILLLIFDRSTKLGFFSKNHYLRSVIKSQRAMYLDNYRDQLPPLCQKYHVKTLWAFGSVLTDRFRPDSDVDMIVAFNDMPVESYADNYFDFKFSLQDILNRPIDLLEQQAIRNPYFLEAVNSTKKMIYGRPN
jgi:predicted nucleotidyltransferase